VTSGAPVLADLDAIGTVLWYSMREHGAPEGSRRVATIVFAPTALLPDGLADVAAAAPYPGGGARFGSRLRSDRSRGYRPREFFGCEPDAAIF
jgi:hypothetical protein